MPTNRSVSYTWPPIDDEVSNSVLHQLATSTSIYGREGIIETFEDRFAQMHKCKYALLTSSGTAALHSAYYALGIGPGDEVICPAYTFFATATPLFQLGALPVLADSTPEGLLDLSEAERLVTDRTKALVITHMWGFPAPSKLYRQFCDDHSIALVEDCSHAHGASVEGVPVGSLADVAAWSLQAGKLIAAGEGGVLCTNSEEIYARATLLGHFNKRAIAEVPANNSLHRFAETGLGLKYRIHPLGVAMASVYLDRLPSWLDRKAINAVRIQSIVDEVDWLEPLRQTERTARCSYYAYPMLVTSTDTQGIREQIADSMKTNGFLDFNIPDTMCSLSKFPLFQSPISPVADYTGSSIRRPVAIAEHLSRQQVRIPVPVDLDIEVYIDTLTTSLRATGRALKLSGGRRRGIERPVQQAAIRAVVDHAREDRVERLVVGALAWRLHDSKPQVLLGRRRLDDFLGGYEELIGGGVEPREGIIDALHREVLEEAGIGLAAVHRILDTFDYADEGGRRARQINFDVELDGNAVEPDGIEHTSFRWVGRADVDDAECTPEVRRTLRWWFASWSAGFHR